MNRMKIISIKNMKVSMKLPQIIANLIVLIAVVFCLTTLPAGSDDAPDSEKKDAEVVKEADKPPKVSDENTDTSSSTNVDTTSSDSGEKPVKITKEIITGTSDTMDGDEKKGITILIGNAKTVRLNEDGIEIGFLNADKITLKRDPVTRKTKEIIAEGNVEIRDQEIFATCEHATMNNLTNIIVLKEKVVVLQKEDRLETKIFTYNRTTGKQTGVGGVKFKVTVTQATPVNPPEESEENGSDSQDTSTTSDKTEEKKTSPETEKESEKKSNSDSDKPDSEEKTTPSDKEKKAKKSESEEDKETEPSEPEETEPSEPEETEPSEPEETEPSEPEETEPSEPEETEPSEPEETDDEESPEEEQ